MRTALDHSHDSFVATMTRLVGKEAAKDLTTMPLIETPLEALDDALQYVEVRTDVVSTCQPVIIMCESVRVWLKPERVFLNRC